MKRKHYTEEQIISILKEHQAGAPVPEIARCHEVAENTIYCWKSKFGGLDFTSDAHQKRGLPNGFVERMNRTLLDEHFRIKGREKWYESEEQIQTDLDESLELYNLKRSHQGYRPKGRTPPTRCFGPKEVAAGRS